MKKRTLLYQNYIKAYILIVTLVLSFPQMLLANSTEDQVLARRISITFDNTNLRKAFSQLQQVRNVDMAYDDKLLQLDTKNIKAKKFDNEQISAILNYLLSGTDITYSLSGKTILILKRPPTQQQGISGRVVDSAGKTFPGASLKVMETNRTYTTNAEGFYTIALPSGSYTIEAAFISFETQRKTVKVENGTGATVDFVLQTSEKLLDQVVIVGYGSQSRRSLSTAISSYDGKKMEGAPVNSIGDNLKGKLAGVRVATTDAQPGANPQFLIRGGSSINQSNEPIIMVDGVQRDITGLNPNDIESIEVLKDAASAGIYGARASNGVILITTKKGGRQDPQIIFQSEAGIQQPETKFNLVSAADYLRILRPALATSLFPGVLSGAESAGTGNTETSIWTTRYLNPGEAVPSGWESIADPVEPSKTLVFQNNDQQKQWFGNAAWQSHYIGVNGGQDKVRYAASAGYNKDSGIGVNTGFSALTFHGNTSFDLSKKLTATTIFDYAQTDLQDLPENKRASVTRGLSIPFTHRDYLANGTPALGPNNTTLPAAFYKQYYDRGNIQKRSTATFKLNYTILDGLNAVAQFTNHNRNTRSNSFTKGNAISTLRETYEGFSELNRINFQGYMNYKKTISNAHQIDLLGGYEYYNDKINTLNAGVTGATSDKVPTLNSGTQAIAGYPNSARTEEAIISYFGRANYSYLNRYLFSLTMRADASSKFSKENRWGYFPAGSAAWIVSDENFWGHKNTVNFLKLRTSYGLTGNNGIGLFDTYGSYINGVKYNGNSTIQLGTMPNLGLKWETTAQFDAGVDMGLFNNKLQLSADFYNKVTRDLLFNISLPDITGYNSGIANVGKVKFYGFDFELNSTNIKKQHFEWSSSFTYSYNMNKVLKLNNNGIAQNRINGIIMGNGTQYGGIAEGERLGGIFGYKVDHIIQNQAQADAALYDALSRGFRVADGKNSASNPALAGRKDIGDYEWVNRPGSTKGVNGNEIINAEDQFLLGNVSPHSTGGLTNTFKYKNYSLGITLDFALGHTIYNALQARYFMATFGNANYNLVYDVQETWKQPGDDTKYAKFTVNDPDWGNSNFSRTSNIFAQKGDYLCIRDVVFTYDLPKACISKLGVKGLALSVRGNTLYYFTAVKGVSPEAVTSGGLYTYADTYDSNYNPYPPARKILLGVKASF
ncbi:SusC/RagA family TonB-linked outer membrane protein [Pedobacter hartonius]|uniref:TonB-linked outer membrane protein, SusC/RagA family n=1 Tax=Pedobacter hartonius TaxID=425514 RepID=A0A1H4H7C7_9SPHI|nr:SusC/RagA family TonB-linked outer membrane protein [Pedobacter hartonius]SEB17733.1 TonB-linked outer membrane protein, SusC/RagA family [Pedobacter hartonius]